MEFYQMDLSINLITISLLSIYQQLPNGIVILIITLEWGNLTGSVIKE